MLEKHLKILCCPQSGESLQLEAPSYADDGHIVSGSLVSSKSKYPIANGVPRFILEKSSEEEQTVNAFGNQWLDTVGFSLNYGQDEAYFSSYLHPLDPVEFGSATVLDAGCGNGRLLEYALSFSPELIVGLDYSNSVELAFRRSRHHKNALIVQGSILRPPIRGESFDKIFSLGVIHHLDDPTAGLASLGQLLNATGKLHVWTYSHEGNEIYLKLVRILRYIATKVSRRSIWRLSTLLAFLTWPYVQLCAFAVKHRSRIRLPNMAYLNFIYHQIGFQIYKLVINDQLIPSIAYYPTRSDIISWAQTADLHIFHLDMRTGNSWRIGLTK